MTLATIAERLGDSCPEVLSIDTEGFELEMLAEADWDDFRPWVVIIEIDNGRVERRAKIRRFLIQRGYYYVRSLGCNELYIRKEGFGGSV